MQWSKLQAACRAEPPGSAVGAVAFLLRAAIWLALCWFMATRFLAGDFWQAVLAVGLLGIPVALVAIYEGSVTKTLRREKYLQQGLLFRLFSGRTLIVIGAFCGAWLAGIFLLLRLHLLSSAQWLLIGAIIPVYWLLFTVLRNTLRQQYKPYVLTTAAMMWARLLCPTLLVLLYLPLLWLWQVPDATLSLGAAIANSQDAALDITASAALGMLAQYLALFDGIRQFVLAHLAVGKVWPLVLVIALDGWLLGYLACTMLALFLLPATELRRIFGRLSDAADLPPVPVSALAFNSALVTFVLCFVFVPAMGYLEVWVRDNPALSQAPARLMVRVEQIGDSYYAPGTLDDLQRARAQVLARLELVEATYYRQIAAGFAAMQGNVDLYLDWYYSLGGEYGRIGNLLVGNLENYMAGKLTETLQQGDVFRDAQATLDATVQSSAEAQALYARLADTILVQSRVEPGNREVMVLQSMPLQDMHLLMPAHQDALGFQNRMLLSSGGAAAAGVLTSVVAGKLTSKIIAKSSFKLAAKSLAKVAAGKAAGSTLGAGAGAATGAALGSVVPGFGTVIGAVIGGIAGGLAVGIGVDKALIEIEELVGREEFRTELLAALDEARAEFQAGAAAN
jgi:hypothetical protein